MAGLYLKQQKLYSYGNEENLPALAPEENQQARFPQPYGYGERPQGAGCTSRKRSQEADRIGRVDVQVRLIPAGK